MGFFAQLYSWHHGHWKQLISGQPGPATDVIQEEEIAAPEDQLAVRPGAWDAILLAV